MKINGKKQFFVSKPYYSTHVLCKFENAVRLFASTAMDRILEYDDNTKVSLGGFITSLKIKRTRRGDKMAVATLYDFSNDIQAVIFPDVYDRCRTILKADSPVLMTGFLQINEGFAKLITSDVEDLISKYEQSKRAESKEALSAKITEVSRDILKWIMRDPELVYTLSPYAFEEFIAEVLTKLGYKVVSTPKTRDGGVDLRILKKEDIGDILYLVECKLYQPRKKVSVAVVRQLYGVVQYEDATGGLIVTTSSFTKDAVNFQKDACYRLSLRDYFGIQEWLQEINEK